MASCNPALAILSHRFCILHLSATHLIEHFRKTKKGETGGPGSFETRGKICFERKVVSTDDWTTQSLWGERGSKVKKVAIDF